MTFSAQLTRLWPALALLINNERRKASRRCGALYVLRMWLKVCGVC